MNIKKCIVAIVNLEYIEIFNKFLCFYNKNCSFDLIVYTVNFDYSHRNTDKIKYISYYDANLIEYEFKNTNKYIKSFSDKYKYLVALKPKIVNQNFETISEFGFFYLIIIIVSQIRHIKFFKNYAILF